MWATGTGVTVRWSFASADNGTPVAVAARIFIARSYIL